MSFCVHPNVNIDSTLDLVDTLLKTVPRSYFEKKPKFYKALVSYDSKLRSLKARRLYNVGILIDRKQYLKSENVKSNDIEGNDDSRYLTEYKLAQNIKYNEAIRDLLRKYNHTQDGGDGAIKALADFFGITLIIWLLKWLLIIVLGIPIVLVAALIHALKKKDPKTFLKLLLDTEDNNIKNIVIYVIICGVSNDAKLPFYESKHKDLYSRKVKELNLEKDDMMYILMTTLILIASFTIVVCYEDSAEREIAKVIEPFMNNTKKLNIVTAKSLIDKGMNKACIIDKVISFEELRRKMPKVLMIVKNIISKRFSANIPTNSDSVSFLFFIENICDNVLRINNINPVVPKPRTPVVNPVAPKPRTPVVNPLVPKPRTPLVNPVVPKPKTPLINPVVPKPKTPLINPVVPKPRTPVVNPVVPKPKSLKSPEVVKQRKQRRQIRQKDNKEKRAPSEYNLFIKNKIAELKAQGVKHNLMKLATIEWNKRKGK